MIWANSAGPHVVQGAEAGRRAAGVDDARDADDTARASSRWAATAPYPSRGTAATWDFPSGALGRRSDLPRRVPVPVKGQGHVGPPWPATHRSVDRGRRSRRTPSRAVREIRRRNSVRHAVLRQWPGRNRKGARACCQATAVTFVWEDGWSDRIGRGDAPATHRGEGSAGPAALFGTVQPELTALLYHGLLEDCGTHHAQARKRP